MEPGKQIEGIGSVFTSVLRVDELDLGRLVAFEPGWTQAAWTHLPLVQVIDLGTIFAKAT